MRRQSEETEVSPSISSVKGLLMSAGEGWWPGTTILERQSGLSKDCVPLAKESTSRLNSSPWLCSPAVVNCHSFLGTAQWYTSE